MAMAALGHHVHIVSLTGKGQWDFKSFDNRISVHQFDLIKDPVRIIRKFDRILPLPVWRYGRSIKRILPSIVNDHAIDIIEATDWGMDAWAYMSVRRTPVCVRLHGYPGFKTEFDSKTLKKWPKNYINWIIQRNHISRADLVSGVSEAYADFVRQAWKLQEKPIQIIPIAVDLNIFQPSDLPREEHSVLFAGRLEELKGLEVLDHAISIVLKEMPNIKFYFAGEDRNQNQTQQTWSQYLTKNHGRENIVYLGSLPTKELVRWYQKSTICVVPSLYEPGGTVVFEAMACGCPVLASRVGGLTEVIQDGRTGLLTPPGDVAALAEGLMKLLHDRQLRMRISREALDSIHHHFNLNMIAQQTLDSYESAIKAFKKPNGQ